MISPINSTAVTASQLSQPPSQQPSAPQTPKAKQDSVQLSQAALAAAGDADHDGDSH
jgi:hypothetical protein